MIILIAAILSPVGYAGVGQPYLGLFMRVARHARTLRRGIPAVRKCRAALMSISMIAIQQCLSLCHFSRLATP